MKELLLTEEETNRAYMGTDYHPTFKLTMETRHGIERAMEAQAKKLVEWIESRMINEYSVPSSESSSKFGELWHSLRDKDWQVLKDSVRKVK